MSAGSPGVGGNLQVIDVDLRDLVTLEWELVVAQPSVGAELPSSLEELESFLTLPAGPVLDDDSVQTFIPWRFDATAANLAELLLGQQLTLTYAITAVDSQLARSLPQEIVLMINGVTEPPAREQAQAAESLGNQQETAFNASVSAPVSEPLLPDSLAPGASDAPGGSVTFPVPQAPAFGFLQLPSVGPAVTSEAPDTRSDTQTGTQPDPQPDTQSGAQPGTQAVTQPDPQPDTLGGSGLADPAEGSGTLPAPLPETPAAQPVPPGETPATASPPATAVDTDVQGAFRAPDVDADVPDPSGVVLDGAVEAETSGEVDPAVDGAVEAETSGEVDPAVDGAVEAETSSEVDPAGEVETPGEIDPAEAVVPPTTDDAENESGIDNVRADDWPDASIASSLEMGAGGILAAHLAAMQLGRERQRKRIHWAWPK